AGLYGTFGGTVSVNVPAVQVTGTFSGDIDTRAATQHVKITGTGVSITIAGQQIGGDVTFEQSAAGVKVTLRNGTLSLGSVLQVQQADGDFSLTSTGVVANVVISRFTFSLGSGISLTLDPGGSISIKVDSAAGTFSVQVLGG